MQRVQTEYSRWFNRGRRRDGALVRGRYAAKHVESLAYRRAVVSYIDRNPVSAGLVPRAGDYPHGSARTYEGGRAEGCPWLARRWVESEVCRVLDLPTYDPSRYAEVFGHLSEDLARVVEARWWSRAAGDPLDDLIRAAPEAVLKWMKREAQLADGVRPGLPVLAPETVEEAIDALSRGKARAWARGRRNGWSVLRAGLLRRLCGLGLDEIGERVGLSLSTAGNFARLHARLLRSDDECARRANLVTSQALGAWERGGK